VKTATAPLLQAFVHVHSFKSSAKPKGSASWAKKGTIADAVAGNDTIIHRAFGSHLKSVILQLPEIDNVDEEEADLAFPPRDASPTLLDT
jgi:hypothetical protein